MLYVVTLKEILTIPPKPSDPINIIVKLSTFVGVPYKIFV